MRNSPADRIHTGTLLLAALLPTSTTGLGQDTGKVPDLGFFITSAGPGDGANLGGLDGGDAHCKALDEQGNTVNSFARGDTPNRHDSLTGSRLGGTAFPPGEDRTCGNWTRNGEGSAMVGHHDCFRRDVPGSPWNSAHGSRGCSQANLESTGGAGLFYCFAAD